MDIVGVDAGHAGVSRLIHFPQDATVLTLYNGTEMLLKSLDMTCLRGQAMLFRDERL